MQLGHIEENELEIYSMRQLRAESAAHIERHLLICATCRDRLLEAEEYIFVMRQAAGKFSRRPRTMLFRYFLPLAASAILTVGAARWTVLRSENPAPFTVSLRTMRGPANQAVAPVGRPLLLRLDLTGLAVSPSYHLEVVDRSGERVWQEAFSGSGLSSLAAIPAQKQGTYFVRISLPSGETLREFQLEIRRTK